MAKKKTRKAPAMAPVIRHQVDSADLPLSSLARLDALDTAGPAAPTGPAAAPQQSAPPAGDPTRPDPDAPPITGPTGRPSVYSEWLNNTPRSPAPSAWLNSPNGENAALRAAMADVGLGPKAARPAAPPPTGGEPAPRQRRTTRARKLSQAERIQLGPDGVPTASGPVSDPARQLAPTVPARSTSGRPADGTTPSGNGPRATRVMAAMPGAGQGQGQRPGMGGTSARILAARPNGSGPGPRGTTGRMPAMPDQPTARVGSARGLPPNAAASTRELTAAGLPATRKPGGPVTSGPSLVIRGARDPKPTGPVVPRRLRPPSFVMQGVVALATVIVLMGALTVSSPLGYGAAVNGTFQAYANAVRWVPTPTPTPTATPVPANTGSPLPSPGQQAVVDEIKQVFGQYAQGALNVSHCESGWDPGARNPYPVGNSHAEGVFQILYPSTWSSTSYASRNPYDYDANIRAAWEIFHRDGNSWREWECQP